METTEVAFVPRTGEGWRDPFPMYRALRDHDPVHRVEAGGYWVLSRFADVFAAARDTATFSSAQGLTFERDERHRAGLDEIQPMVMLDPPEHTAFRAVVDRYLTFCKDWLASQPASASRWRRTPCCAGLTRGREWSLKPWRPTNRNVVLPATVQRRARNEPMCWRRPVTRKKRAGFSKRSLRNAMSNG